MFQFFISDFMQYCNKCKLKIMPHGKVDKNIKAFLEILVTWSLFTSVVSNLMHLHFSFNMHTNSIHTTNIFRLHLKSWPKIIDS